MLLFEHKQLLQSYDAQSSMHAKGDIVFYRIADLNPFKANISGERGSEEITSICAF